MSLCYVTFNNNDILFLLLYIFLSVLLVSLLVHIVGIQPGIFM